MIHHLRDKAELGDPFAAYRLAQHYQRRYYTLLQSIINAHPHASIPFPYHYLYNGGLKAFTTRIPIKVVTTGPISQTCIDACALAHINAEYYFFMAAALAKHTGRQWLRTYILEKIARYNI